MECKISLLLKVSHGSLRPVDSMLEVVGRLQGSGVTWPLSLLFLDRRELVNCPAR